MSTRPVDREVEISQETPTSYVRFLNSLIDDFGEDVLGMIEAWALMTVQCQYSNEDKYIAAATILRFRIADAVAEGIEIPENAFTSRNGINDEATTRDRLLSVGMQMQIALQEQEQRHSRMSISEIDFYNLAVRCDCKTHLIVRETGLDKRTVQARKKRLGLPKSAE